MHPWLLLPLVVLLASSRLESLADEDGCPPEWQAECNRHCCKHWISRFGVCGKSAEHQAGGIDCTACAPLEPVCVPSNPIPLKELALLRGRALVNEPAKLLVCHILKNGCSGLIHFMFNSANRTYSQWEDLTAPEGAKRTSPWASTFSLREIQQMFDDDGYARVRSAPPCAAPCRAVNGRMRSRTTCLRECRPSAHPCAVPLTPMPQCISAPAPCLR